MRQRAAARLAGGHQVYQGIVGAETAAGVDVAGTIGFVGLILPHLARLLVGPGHRRLLPAAALLGAPFFVLLMRSDRLERGGSA